MTMYPPHISPPVVFNMDLANGDTSGRFCHEAAAVLGTVVSSADTMILGDRDHEFRYEVVDDYTERLEAAGYGVHWDAGDVVVYDLRQLSDEDRRTFWDDQL